MNNLNKLVNYINSQWEQFGSLEWAVMGLSSEVGEVVDCLIKTKYYNKDKELEFKEELADCLHYLLAICYFLKIDLNDLSDQNLSKLQKRYPTGWNPDQR